MSETPNKQILKETEAEGHSFYSREVSRLSAGRESRGNKDGPNGPTPDDMVLSLLLQINEESSVKGKTGSDLDGALVDMLRDHKVKLGERQGQVKEKIRTMEEEDKKKITSDNIKQGWSSGVSHG